MRKYLWVISLFLSYLMIGGSTCRVKTCPVKSSDYNLHHLTEKGFKHIFSVEKDCIGCHHVSAEKCGWVKLEKIRTGKNGVFVAEVKKIKEGNCIKDSSTFFPEHWSIQATLNKIEEAFQNSYRVDYEHDKYKKRYNQEGEYEDTPYMYKIKREIRKGKTAEGITIKIIMDTNDKNKIFNAYPLCE